VPVVPSTVTAWPSCSWVVPTRVATTAGTPNSRRVTRSLSPLTDRCLYIHVVRRRAGQAVQ
jgi:hypothetical protein